MSYSNGIKIDDETTAKIIKTATEIVNERGVEKLTVSAIIRELKVSNRVFYNRFCNIHELLEVIYELSVMKMREVLENSKWDESEDYIDYHIRLLAEVLKMTYTHKKRFSHFMFEHDSMSENNRKWWVDKVKNILDTAISKKLIRNDINTENISYSIWCFCRGFNTDAVNRNIPLEDALKIYSETFSVFLQGLKT